MIFCGCDGQPLPRVEFTNRTVVLLGLFSSPVSLPSLPQYAKRNYGLLDVIAAVRDINRVGVGYRVANLYDIDLKTYLFKLQKKTVQS